MSKRAKRAEVVTEDVRQTAPGAWRNRITSTAILRAGDFVANESNWRIHPHTQEQALGEVLDKVGWCGVVMVNKRTDPSWGEKRCIETLVDGHERVAMALSKGEDEPVPTFFVDLDPDEERLVLMSFDPISAMATTDSAKMTELLAETASMFANQGPLLAELKALCQGDRKETTFKNDAPMAYRILVECDDEAHQATLLEQFATMAVSCRALIECK